MRHALVLCYHHAGTPPPAARERSLYVSPGALRAQVAWLARRGYAFTTVSRLYASNSERVACVTFDDGYRDTLEVALPVLRDLDVPATLFVVTADAGSRHVLWPEELPGVVPADLLDWDGVRELARAGWEIGSHNHQHRRMPGLDPAMQRQLARTSFEVLADRLGERPRSFAYPYGAYDRDTIAAVRDAGFAFGATTRRGRVVPGQHPLELRRIIVHGTRAWHATELVKLSLAGRGLYPLPRRSSAEARP